MDARYLQKILVDDITIEDLILAEEALKTLDAGFQNLGVSTPEWVTDKLGLVSSEMVQRNRAELQKRLKAAKARRAALATADEKRAKLDAEITALEQQVG